MKGKVIWLQKREYDSDGKMYTLDDHEWTFEVEEPDYNPDLYDKFVLFELEE